MYCARFRRYLLLLLIPISMFINFAPLTPAEEEHDHATDNTQPESGRKPSDVLGVGGAIWLERPGREEEEKPELLISLMGLKETDVVADLGCGSGFITRRLSPHVPKGKVLATDIQPGMIEILKKNIEKEKLTNIEPILGTPTDPKLPKGGVDWILLVDVYHEFQDPKPMLAKMRESLSEKGKIALVEYRLDGDTAKHIRESHRMSIKQVLAEWNPAGFELEDISEELPTQRLFIFHKRNLCPDDK